MTRTHTYTYKEEDTGRRVEGRKCYLFSFAKFVPMENVQMKWQITSLNEAQDAKYPEHFKGISCNYTRKARDTTTRRA